MRIKIGTCSIRFRAEKGKLRISTIRTNCTEHGAVQMAESDTNRVALGRRRHAGRHGDGQLARAHREPFADAGRARAVDPRDDRDARRVEVDRGGSVRPAGRGRGDRGAARFRLFRVRPCAAARARRSRAAAGSRGRSAVAHAAVAGGRREGAQAGLRLDAAVMAAGRRRAPRVACGGARSAVAARRLREPARSCPRCVSNSPGGSRSMAWRRRPSRSC